MLEQFTGAWCGWCVDGSVVMEELVKEFPDNFIGVKMHQGDAMEIPKVFDSIKTMVPFYPSGSIDRMSFPGESTVGTSREKWKEYVLKQMAKQCDVDVKVTNVTYDKATRKMTADVEATFAKSMSGDLRLGLMVVEDDVTGSGTGYDQHNYISGNPSFKGHPYYDLPGTIEGYHHKSVVRAYPGGVWGVKGIIPAITSSNTPYKATFTYTVPAGFDAGNILLVGTVQKYGAAVTAREILNAHQVGLLKSPAIMESTIAGKFQAIPASGKGEAEVTIKNNNQSAVSVALEIDKQASIIPDGWNATLSGATMQLEAGASMPVKVNLTTNAVPGFTKIVVNAIVSGESVFTKSIKSVIYSLSPEIKHAVYGVHPRMNVNYKQYLDGLKPNTTVMMPLDADILTGFPPTTFDLAVIAVDFENTDIIAGNTQFIQGIASMLQNGKKVFMASGQLISSLLKGSDVQTKAMFEQILGISVKTGSPIKRFEQDANSGDILMAYPIVLKGVSGDYISRNVSSMLNSDFVDIASTPFCRYTDVFTLMPNSQAISILNYDEKPEDIAAVRWEKGDARLVILGFDMDGLSDVNARYTIMNRAYNWLLQGAASIDEQQNESFSLQAQPNPGNGLVNIQYSVKGSQEQHVSLRVLNILGMEVFSTGAISASPGNHSFGFDASMLPAGNYRMILSGNQNASVQIPLMIIR